MSGDPSPDLPPNPDLQRLSTCLHEARLREGISLDDLARRLHMGREQLHSLEQADTAALPEQVFVIAQARRVACALGVNIDSEIQALRRSQAPAGGTAAAPAEPVVIKAPPRDLPPRPGGTGRSRGGAIPTPLKLVGLAALVGAAGLAAWRILPTTMPPSPQAATTTPKNAASPSPSRSPAARPAPTPQSDALTLKAGQASWLEVRTATGTSLFRGTLEGERSFPYRGDLLVLAGRPDLVEVAEPGAGPRPLGRIDQVRWQRFKAPAP
ncbi:helix-turn-helix domain-containing protein [Cyanobium sp. NIES-981]|uniref:helix-turn-helix domain-containing protein n=1 Tax=Cyanobium sp. NIES-981 TaxID=1851505 RepID=UPI0007DD779C|nr:helix-turn-helix domain-containing protein [Cyanobium sp. NIES-981]SBO42991.1 putative Transcriptional regulator, XRE family [Cyanobium sp. NIES-981]